MNAPPTAAEIVADPTKVVDVDAATLPAILAQLTTASAAVAARLSAIPGASPATESPDKLLKADEAAGILNVSTDWLYKSDAAKPLRVSMGGNVRFSHLAIQRYIARHRGR